MTRPILPKFRAVATALMFVGLVYYPAVAGDTGANKAGLVGSLLPTVVNVSVRKSEPAEPASPMMASASQPPASAGETIRGVRRLRFRDRFVRPDRDEFPCRRERVRDYDHVF